MRRVTQLLANYWVPWDIVSYGEYGESMKNNMVQRDQLKMEIILCQVVSTDGNEWDKCCCKSDISIN